MSENKCDYYEIHDREIKENKKRIAEHDVIINKVVTKQAVNDEKMLNVLEKISKLPEAIDSLKSSQDKFEIKLDNNCEDFKQLKQQINDRDDRFICELSEIKKKDEIHILDVLKKYWWSIVLFAGIVVAIIVK